MTSTRISCEYYHVSQTDDTKYSKPLYEIQWYDDNNRPTKYLATYISKELACKAGDAVILKNRGNIKLGHDASIFRKDNQYYYYVVDSNMRRYRLEGPFDKYYEAMMMASKNTEGKGNFTEQPKYEAPRLAVESSYNRVVRDRPTPSTRRGWYQAKTFDQEWMDGIKKFMDKGQNSVG